jgi:hypothetical protein
LAIVMAIAAGVRGKTPPMPDDDGWRLLRSGDHAGAEQAAAELLRRADAADDSDWPPGDLRQMAHALLGFISLGRDDLDEAEAELRRSAEVGDTPVLGSFGPDLGLLWELLRRGRADAAVYFAQRYGEFWPGPGHRSLGNDYADG